MLKYTSKNIIETQNQIIFMTSNLKMKGEYLKKINDEYPPLRLLLSKTKKKVGTCEKIEISNINFFIIFFKKYYGDSTNINIINDGFKDLIKKYPEFEIFNVIKFTDKKNNIFWRDIKNIIETEMSDKKIYVHSLKRD